MTEHRVGILAVNLAMEQGFEPVAAGEALARASEGSPTALQRALGRVQRSPSEGRGPISRRAAHALRMALRRLGHDSPAGHRVRPGRG